MQPIIPHFSNECMEILKKTTNEWPTVNEEIIKEKKTNIVIQINGKKRDLINLEKSMDKDQLIKLIEKNKKIQKFVLGKTIKKTVYVQDKLINLII